MPAKPKPFSNARPLITTTFSTGPSQTASIEIEGALEAAAISSHSTATSDDSWDGPANEANLSADKDSAYYRKAYAWQEADTDGTKKSQFKFIHHFVSTDGTVGSASTVAASTGIGVLNGGRGGTTIPTDDKDGVYAHLARHLKDAGKDVPEKQFDLKKAASVNQSNGMVGDLPAQWEAVLIQEGVQTDDNRYIEPNALGHRELPLPMMHLDANLGYGHRGSQLAGAIDSIERQGQDIYAIGRFDLGGESGREAARQVASQMMRWVSADVAVLEWDIVDNCEDPWDWTCNDWYEVVLKGSLLGATMVPTPAFEHANIQALLASGERHTRPMVIAPLGQLDSYRSRAVEEGLWTPPQSLTACGCGDPEEAWFANPHFGITDGHMVQQLDGQWGCPNTVLDSGQVFGHLCLWGTCHIGFRDECIQPFDSKSGFAYFMTGSTTTKEGNRVKVGQLTLSGGHADSHLDHRRASAHYDETHSAIADVAIGGDEFGIWYAGALRPEVTPEQVRAFKASSISGDWRRIGGEMELVAACCVNVPGFPVVRASAGFEGQEQVSLVAAGSLPPRRFGGTGGGREMAAIRALFERVDRLENSMQPLLPLAAERLLDRIRS